MSEFIEPLENRRLLSVSPALSRSITADVAALKGEATAIKAQAGALLSSIKSEHKTLISDVHALKVSSNARRLTSLNHDQQVGATTVKRVGATLAKDVTKDANKVVADLRKLAAKPGNADLEAVLSVDTAALTSNVTATTSALAGAFSSAVSLIQADLNDISVANSGSATIQADTAAESDTLSSDLTAANAANAILVADVTQLLTDAG